ncbi:hypothetical protein GALMADRAFT_259747 [Galerina marginata CBS 339.88]|uniref:Uncharacterized protein n=1 Tax=Galerina marginata (strain CBS 339.88) TaxID=685588 RepID=A0A067SH43_GALM3|nr:hypothetical protein GALMADRAFT_259747 [Galerina marginata CBS 339.88]
MLPHDPVNTNSRFELFSGAKSSGIRHYEFVVTGPGERRGAFCKYDMMPHLSLLLTLLVTLAQTPHLPL